MKLWDKIEIVKTLKKCEHDRQSYVTYSEQILTSPIKNKRKELCCGVLINVWIVKSYKTRLYVCYKSTRYEK